MNANQEMRLSQFIETALCMLGLYNAVIAIKQAFGFAKNEMIFDHSAIKSVIAHVVDIGLNNIGKEDGLTLNEYIVVARKSSDVSFTTPAPGLAPTTTSSETTCDGVSPRQMKFRPHMLHKVVDHQP